MTLEQYEKLKENIKKTGKYPSLIVLKRKDRYLLFDGHNRLAVIKELGHTNAWCEVWELEEKYAKLFLATVNRLRGTDDVYKRARLIQEVCQLFGDDKKILLHLLPESEKSLDALLKLSTKDLKALDQNLKVEKEFIESQLTQIVPEKEAKRMASVYKEETDEMRLVFNFKNSKDYQKALNYFGYKPSPEKLMALI